MLLTAEIASDTDVVRVATRARQLAVLLGFSAIDQARLTTAVSEVSRELSRRGAGRVEFDVHEDSLVVRVSAAGGVVDVHESEGLAAATKLLDRCVAGEAAIELWRALPAGTSLSAERRQRIDEELARLSDNDALLELRSQNRALLHALEELERATRVRQMLLAVVSHDLRNPLSTILMTAEVLERGEDDDEDTVPQHAQRIVRAAEAMKRLISDMMDLASIEAGELPIVCAPHRLADVIQEAVELHRPLGALRSIDLAAGAHAEELVVSCDRGRVMQIFANLLGDAVKLAPREGAIVVSAARDGAFARVSIALSGVHDEASDLRAQGLGLSIATGLVEGHRGTLWIDSAPGRGALFCFTLPLAG